MSLTSNGTPHQEIHILHPGKNQSLTVLSRWMTIEKRKGLYTKRF